MGHLDSGSIIGIAIGVPSAVLAFISLVIGFCAWKYPQSPPGQVGHSIAQHLPSIKGGFFRGGDAHGYKARAGDAHGTNIEIEGDPGARDIEGGEAQGGKASGTEVEAGDAYGGTISLKFPFQSPAHSTSGVREAGATV
jgi:hypothetical protein